MAITAQRIGVDLIDELAHRVDAVANHIRWVAARRSDQSVSHDEHAEVVARDVTLDDHVAADVRCRGKGGAELDARFDVDRDPLALVAVARLDHHGKADAVGHFPGLFLARDDVAGGNRNPGGVQQHLGEVLILGDGLRDRAGAVGFGGLDAPLLAAPAELHHAAFRQSPIGNAARHGGIDDGAGTWSETYVLVELAQPAKRQANVEGFVVHRSLAQCSGKIQRESPDRLLGVLHDDLEHAWLRRRDCLAKCDRATGGGL